MNEQAVITDEEAQRAATMYRVYSYFLQLAARKEAAERGELGDCTRTAAHDTPANEPGAEGV